jgi:hypothetical protein
MKTLPVVSFMLLVLPAVMRCDSDEESPDCPQLSIEAIFPFAAAADDPVLIKGNGFNSENITVRFGSLTATVVQKNASYISTKVPTGLGGLVELSVTNELGCIAVKTFEVSSQSPAGTPGSPPVYFIPPGGFSFAINLPSVEYVILKNFYDEDHELTIFPFREISTFGGESNYEKWGADTNPISGTLDLGKNEVIISIQRSDKPDDLLVGGFHTMTIPVNGVDKTDNFFIAFSTITGIQYLFYR